MSTETFHLICRQCGDAFEHTNRRRLYCSKQCEHKYSNEKRSPNFGKAERICQRCSKKFQITNRGDGARKYCSSVCSKNAHSKKQSTWKFRHATKELYKKYRTNQIKKHPKYRTRSGIRRDLSIAALGGKCIIPGCGVTKLTWLHIDFIATTIGMKHRHPRHWAYIRDHLNEFRLLCANHHYELTLTGKIDGTDITQPRHIPKKQPA